MSSISRDECVLRWTNHETLVQGVCTDLLDSERFADVTLFCNDDHRGLKCHRFILAACSSYFDGIFGNDSSPLSLNFTQVAIVLKDVNRGCMEDLLHFIYRGELTVAEAKLDSFIQLAKSLGVKGLCDFTGSPSEMKKLHHHSATPAVATYSDPDEDDEHVIEYDNDSSEQPIFIGMNSEQEEEEEFSEGGSNSDALLSVSTSSMGGNRSGCYKQYTEDEMQAALKWVLEGGAKPSEACVQFGLPLTTFSRRMRRYKEQLKRQQQQQSPKVNKGPAVIIPLIKEEEQEEQEQEDSGQEEEEEMDLVIERVESHRKTEEVGEEEEDDERKKRRRQRRRESQGGIQYKTYTGRQLRDAMSAVQSGRMKTADASQRFGIPLTTLTRKIRSAKAAANGDATASSSNGTGGK